VLLYPDPPQNLSHNPPPDATLAGRTPPVPTPLVWPDPARLRLVVLDGTWRKSRKMLYQNPLLQQLPRLSLSDCPASRYLIRKAHRPDQLSTLEACCAALMQLEARTAPFQALLTAFDGFVAQQLDYRPPPGRT
jgi:DTW domain-containing protein YfiP